MVPTPKNDDSLRSDAAEWDAAIGRAVVDDLVHGDASQASAVQKRRESGVGDAELEADAGELREVGPGLTFRVGVAIGPSRVWRLVTVDDILENIFKG